MILRFFAVRLRMREAHSIPVGPSKWLQLAALVTVLGGVLSFNLRAQATAAVPVSNSQEAPQSTGAVPASPPQPVPPQSPASVAGTVFDQGGKAVPGARITLVTPGDTVPRIAMTDSTGAFALTGLPPGAYQVQVYVPGIEPLASTTVVLGASEKQDLPLVVVRMPTKNTTIDVNATLNEVAMEQVHEEEQQRIFGFMPNYYTSYIWNAAPMTTKLKFKLALRTLTDPFGFVVVGAAAGVEQAHKTFPGYGQESEGYAKRYAGNYADTVSGRMIGSAILPALLHQDPRYFYQGSGTVRSRLLHALMSAVVCRGDDGRLEPNYSHLLGSFAAAGLSNIYRDPQDRRAGLTIRNGFIITGGSAAVSVMREFFSRSATSNVPAFANGKP